MTVPSLTNRVALVTGASRGIGRAVALALSKAGAHVIACARRQSALEDLDDEIQRQGGTATLVQFDLKDAEKIDLLGPSIYARWKKLDIFVGNAAILGPLSPLNHIKASDWQDVMAVNTTANWLLLRTLDPLLRASDAGRVVFMTAAAAEAKRAYWAPYATSKAGLEALAKTYAQEVENASVRVNLIDPGPVRTELRARAYPGENPGILTAPEAVAPLVMKAVAADFDANGTQLRYPEDL
ncbi:MAG: SDR family NAD(P)-dependent oxidoreductase [Pseudomonadota bacterium]